MKTFIDTNLLYYKYSGKNIGVELHDNYISSINALEFLKNINKNQTHRANYYLPRVIPKYYDLMLLVGIKKRDKKQPFFSPKVADSIIFDFKNEFPTHILYNNHSISNTLNNKQGIVFRTAIEFMEKEKYKDIRNKFEFLINTGLKCESILADEINLAYDLLGKFIDNYTPKNDFINTWNDILILAKVITAGGLLISDDNLLNRFASECYSGRISKRDNFIELRFPEKELVKVQGGCKESKGYVNRGWFYMIKSKK